VIFWMGADFENDSDEELTEKCSAAGVDRDHAEQVFWLLRDAAAHPQLYPHGIG